ncbi:MAG: chemotaxis protein CheW [Nitrospirota bacterium]
MTVEVEAVPESAPAVARQWLICRVANEDYLLEVPFIKEIIRLPEELTAVPRAPEWLKGICSLRGIVIPVIDVSRRLGLGACNVTSKSRVVVLSTGKGLGGLLVAGVQGLIGFEPSQANPPPPLLAAPHRELLRGIVHEQGRTFILLELERVMTVHQAPAERPC